jgi:hypothetical protein
VAWLGAEWGKEVLRAEAEGAAHIYPTARGPASSGPATRAARAGYGGGQRGVWRRDSLGRGQRASLGVCATSGWSKGVGKARGGAWAEVRRGMARGGVGGATSRTARRRPAEKLQSDPVQPQFSPKN